MRKKFMVGKSQGGHANPCIERAVAYVLDPIERRHVVPTSGGEEDRVTLRKKRERQALQSRDCVQIKFIIAAISPFTVEQAASFPHHRTSQLHPQTPP